MNRFNGAMIVVTGVLLQLRPGDYNVNFVVAGSIYLVTLGLIHLLVPQIRQADVDAPIDPFSVGSIIGFGFVGLVFGTFAAWIVGLVNAAGPAMIKYLAIGANVGALVGIVGGIAITRSQRAAASRR
jgi:hypothetical protein